MPDASGRMRLSFVGDIALGDHPKTVGFGFRSRYPRGIPAALSARLAPPGPTPDLMFGNLEFPLDDAMNTTSVMHGQCRGMREYAGFLATAGIGAVNVANNHIFQHGASTFHSTVEVLRAARIHVVGIPSDFSEAGIIEIGNRRVALLGWSDRPRQYAQDQPPYNEFSELAYAQVADARRRADVVVASIHWGDEFILLPSERERRIARAMIEAGASLVVGHHPHVIREVEPYAGGVIAYSLGNFVGDMVWDSRTRFTSWLTAELDDEGVASALVTRGVIDDDYFPRPLTGEEEARVARELAAASRSERARLTRTSYGAVAEAARRRHVLRTALMMLRNIGRYPTGAAVEMVRAAVSHRVLNVLSGDTDRSVMSP